MKRLTLLLILIFPISLFAQDFTVPDYKFEKAEDFAPYNEEVLRGIDWILETPLGEQADKRKTIYAFLMAWMTGSPDVHIVVDQNIVTSMGGPNPDLLMIFLSGWTQYALTSDKKENLRGNLRGIEAVIAFYKKNNGVIQKDKNVDKYIKLQEKGKLEEEIQKQLK